MTDDEQTLQVAKALYYAHHRKDEFDGDEVRAFHGFRSGRGKALRRLDLQDIDGGLELRASSLEYTRARSSAIRRDRNEVRFLYAGPNPF